MFAVEMGLTKMKVWFTTTARNGQYREDERFLEEMRSRLCLYNLNRYHLADSPEQADAILYFEPNHHKLRNYVSVLLAEEPIRRYPEKCFVVDYTDSSPAFLPGVYVCLSQDRINRQRLRAGCYMGEYNNYCMELAERRHEKPNLLFSFRGAASHAVRTALFKADFAGENASIMQVHRWFDHTEEEKYAAAEEMLNSKFVLCPRGLGTTSIRLFEVMQLGRVPVILSDQWVAPDGPSWNDCAVIVAEDKVSELPTIIKSFEGAAEEMGRLAREEWEAWFSPRVRVTRTVQSIESIRLQRPAGFSEKTYQDAWQTWGFAWEQGWTPVQSLGRSIRQGTLLGKIQSKLLHRPIHT